MTLSADTMYNALLQKDSTFEGTFYAGIKTTGIFCRPTCTARKPKKENVEYFFTQKEAILHGYRPCKVCSPMTVTGTITFQQLINTSTLSIKELNTLEKSLRRKQN